MEVLYGHALMFSSARSTRPRAVAFAAAIILAVSACSSAAPSIAPTASPTALALAATGTSSTSPSTNPTNGSIASPTGSVPNFSHVYVIVLENKEDSSIVGSHQAPYLNSLIAQYGLAANFYAEGHPSEPNYIALTSGGIQGVTSDGVYDLGVDNVFSQVSASGRTWRSYEQGYPGACFRGSSSPSVADGTGLPGGYVRKHNPAVSYTRISGNAKECANITDLASFDPSAANLEFITPNLINDMHSGSIADGDSFLQAFVPKITASPAFANSVVFVTFDEGSSSLNGGGHIVTIVISPNMKPGYQSSDTYSHYSILRTIEQAWGLPYLGGASSAVPMEFPY